LADDYERHSNESLVDAERYVGNPVNAYLLIKRFTSDWEGLVNTKIRSSNAEGFIIGVPEAEAKATMLCPRASRWPLPWPCYTLLSIHV